MLSDALKSMQVTEEMEPTKKRLFDAAVYGTLSLDHANQFRVFVKRQDRRHYVHQMLKGKASWPSDPDDQDWLVFLVDSFRDVLITELPQQIADMSSEVRRMSYIAKGLISELASRNEELARLLLTQSESSATLPNWFLAQVVRDLPNLAIKREKTAKAL
jgi:archaellum biogenesis ATPase FlaH